MNIYVSNLSFAVQDDDLRGFFEEYGEVSSAKVIMDKFTNRSRGFGFVEMENEADALKAIEELNGSTIGGRAVVVNKSEPRPEGERRSFNNNRSGGGYGGNSRGGGYGGGRGKY